jgi:uncharacterized protein YbaA (DUF1428 family)
MSYVDGFVLPIKTKNLDAYKKMANKGREVWMKHGALQYFECAGDDLNPAMGEDMESTTFPKLAQIADGETVIFAFIVFKSREHRDQVNAKVMKEMGEQHKDGDEENMPFDVARMAYGGFQTIVEA